MTDKIEQRPVIATRGRDIGRRVRAARASRGWDQSELARRAGVASSYVSRLEAGKFPTPSADRLARISEALGQRITDLTEPPPPPDESEEAAFKRLLEQQIGKDNAPIVAALLPQLRGWDPAEVKRLAGIVAALNSGR